MVLAGFGLKVLGRRGYPHCKRQPTAKLVPSLCTSVKMSYVLLEMLRDIGRRWHSVARRLSGQPGPALPAPVRI